NRQESKLAALRPILIPVYFPCLWDTLQSAICDIIYQLITAGNAGSHSQYILPVIARRTYAAINVANGPDIRACYPRDRSWWDGQPTGFRSPDQPHNEQG